jgi:hypothetical protein
MIDQNTIKRIIELSDIDSQDVAQMQEHFEMINELAIILLFQATLESKRAKAESKAPDGPWLTNGYNDSDFGQDLPVDGAWPV